MENAQNTDCKALEWTEEDEQAMAERFNRLGQMLNKYMDEPEVEKTDTPYLVAALRVLSDEIHSDDGVANAAIAEAADRLEALYWECISCHSTIESLENRINSAAQILGMSNS